MVLTVVCVPNWNLPGSDRLSRNVWAADNETFPPLSGACPSSDLPGPPDDSPPRRRCPGPGRSPGVSSCQFPTLGIRPDVKARASSERYFIYIFSPVGGRGVVFWDRESRPVDSVCVRATSPPHSRPEVIRGCPGDSVSVLSGFTTYPVPLFPRTRRDDDDRSPPG